MCDASTSHNAQVPQERKRHVLSEDARKIVWNNYKYFKSINLGNVLDTVVQGTGVSKSTVIRILKQGRAIERGEKITFANATPTPEFSPKTLVDKSVEQYIINFLNAIIMAFVNSTRGAKKFVCEDNFVYVFSKKTADKEYAIWVCERRRKCKGRVWTAGNALVVSRKVVEHNHAADAVRPEKLRVVQNMKERASNAKETNNADHKAVPLREDHIRGNVGYTCSIEEESTAINSEEGHPCIRIRVRSVELDHRLQYVESNLLR
ncbi:hypothetical protein FQA39_LY06766 [Lamprigera yunnana]|nr:hypothetical protein FQA39_LY06766 [Lamprigera yunnana]